jgi:C-terminal processing protease CtpA/Prc
MKTLRAACLIGFLPVLGIAQVAPPPDAPTGAQPFEPVLASQHQGPGRIGARIDYDKVTGLPYIAALIRGGAAEDFGFRVGDIIIKIDKNFTNTLTPDQVSLALHGEPGSGVQLTIQRDDNPKWIVRSLERRVVPAGSEDMINPPMSGVGVPPTGLDKNYDR